MIEMCFRYGGSCNHVATLIHQYSSMTAAAYGDMYIETKYVSGMVTIAAVLWLFSCKWKSAFHFYSCNLLLCSQNWIGSMWLLYHAQSPFLFLEEMKNVETK